MSVKPLHPPTASCSDEASASLIISLWAKTHAQAGQVSVGEGKEHHEGDEPAIMEEEDRELETRLYVAQHEERDEGQAEHDQQGEQQVVLLRLGEEEQASKNFFVFVDVPPGSRMAAYSFQCHCLFSGKKGF